MPPLTLAEYMDPARFPLTTQTGLTPEQQMRIDAFNHDQLKEHVLGTPLMNEEYERRWAELREKVEAQPALLAEVRGAKKAQGPV